MGAGCSQGDEVVNNARRMRGGKRRRRGKLCPARIKRGEGKGRWGTSTGQVGSWITHSGGGGEVCQVDEGHRAGRVRSQMIALRTRGRVKSRGKRSAETKGGREYNTSRIARELMEVV